jgi:hypothetical protein
LLKNWQVGFASWLAAMFHRWSVYWTDVADAALTGRTREQVKTDRERAEQREEGQ